MVLDAWWDAVFGGAIGLLFGSFLNVVIYRLPKMMERQWAAELAQVEAVSYTHLTLPTIYSV